MLLLKLNENKYLGEFTKEILKDINKRFVCQKIYFKNRFGTSAWKLVPESYSYLVRGTIEISKHCLDLEASEFLKNLRQKA